MSTGQWGILLAYTALYFYRFGHLAAEKKDGWFIVTGIVLYAIIALVYWVCIVA